MTPESEAAPKSSGSVALPTGTVTFLFSDIEGSTERWEQHRAAMDAAVKRHDALMRSAAERHNGYVFKTVGDAFCVAFARVSEATNAAVDVQRKLNAEDFSAIEGLQLRIGLHAGEASERNGDYFGPAVNRVARLMSIGHGGQVLLSGVTRDLASRDLPTGVSLIDLGSHLLKGLAEPEHIWQLAIEGLPTQFPPLKSVDALPNNLPNQPTSFCGREHDLEEVKSLLAKHQILTLSGAGGIGKTRVALQAGADLLDHYPDGVWFADFAPISDPELAASDVAKVLGVNQSTDRSVDDSVVQWLRRKHVLLILDNCEHLLEAVANLADAVLHTCPGVRILATSRQPMGLAGEIVYRLPSLAVPERAAGLKAGDAVGYGAIALFVDRAKAADLRFTLTDDNVPIVADICRRLDGIALAIELAAARVKVLSIPNLAQRLNNRFKILSGGTRGALPRQKTLAALIDWSYDLLLPQEQKLFNRVGIFAGGFSLDAATAVCSGDGVGEFDILDLLASLTDKSLMVADTTGESERYRLLESTRSYALEKLAAKGEREHLARRHAEYFRDQASRAEEAFGTMSATAWAASLEPEVDNFRASLEWTIKEGRDVALGGAIAGALEHLWMEGGLEAEGRWWIGAALRRIDEAEQPRIVARLWLALASITLGKPKLDAAERARQLYEKAAEALGLADALTEIAYALMQMGKPEEASAMNMRALAIFRERDAKRGIARCLNWQATIILSCGEITAARELYAQAVAAYRALGDETRVATVLGNLAELEFEVGEPERAFTYVTEAMNCFSVSKNVTMLATYQNNIAAYTIALGDLDRAREAAREGLRWARKAGNPDSAVAAQHLALIAARHGDAERGARLMGFSDAVYFANGLKRFFTEQWSYDKLRAALCEKLTEAEIAKLAAEGATWSEDQAIEEALKV